MKRFGLPIFALFLIFSSLSAQNGSSANIIGKVFDEEGTPIPFANIILFSAVDSNMVKGEYTTDDGTYRLSGIHPDDYWLRVNLIGFEDFNTDLFSLSAGQSLNLPTINLAPVSSELAQVEVKAERAMIEVQPDKTVFNVQGSINATGNSALELLKKAPGVVVDNNDNIILAGKNGVKIYIDGRPSYLSTSDLATQLSAMQSSEIDAIEIITNPPAKYEAEGNAGIINIRLVKDKSMGANANLNMNYTYGKHSKYNPSINFNLRQKKFNLFGNYSYNDGTWENTINLYRIQNNVLFDQKSVMLHTGAYHGGKLGTDFFLSKKSTLGILVNASQNQKNFNNTARTPVTDLETNEGLYLLEATSKNDGFYRNVNANVNYKFDGDDGLSWNADLDWGLYSNRNEAYQPNTFRSFDGETILEERIFSSRTPTDIKIYTAKLDHERSLLGGTFGTGVKLSYVKTDNTYDFFNIENGEEVLDIDRSNNFVFEENINALYASWSKKIKKTTVNLGVRLEQTNSTGTLTAMKPVNNDQVVRNYFDYFPSGGVSYQANDKNQFRVNYSRRIDRPNYQDLNPFEFKLDELTYRRGNPFLSPQYTHSVALSHTYNYRLTTSLSYSHTRDFFANISDTTETDRSFLETINLDFQEVISLTVSYPVSPTEWWNTYTSFTGYHTHNKAELSQGRIVDVRATVASLYHQSTFTLPKEFSLEVSGWFSSPSIWGAIYKTETNFAIDMGISKKIFNKRGNIKVSVTDIFYTAPWHAVQDIAGLYIEASGTWESRALRVNFSYLFGNDKVKKERRRKTGLEDEAGRTGGDN